MSDTPTCPDCAKALERWHKRERSMAARGNFGIVPLPVRCAKHSNVSPITQASHIATLEAQLVAQQRENARLREALEEAKNFIPALLELHGLAGDEESERVETVISAALAQGAKE